MERIDFEVAFGSVERWRIRGIMVAHPFHVHGVRFRVFSEDGAPPRPENTGGKDTVLVLGEAEILVRFDQPASRSTPEVWLRSPLENLHDLRQEVGSAQALNRLTAEFLGLKAA